MSDLISRQAAIDLCDWYDNPSMHDDLEKLPSAQPTNISKTEDLIIRGDAINAVFERIKQIGFEDNVDVLSIRQAVRDVPSAQPEPRWIPCSEKLPEEDQYNLVTMQHANGEIDVVIARLVKPYSKNVPWEWESDDAEWTWSFGNGFAWMPLPEVYKEKCNG